MKNLKCSSSKCSKCV